MTEEPTSLRWGSGVGFGGRPGLPGGIMVIWSSDRSGYFNGGPRLRGGVMLVLVGEGRSMRNLLCLKPVKITLVLERRLACCGGLAATAGESVAR